jgi:hypothetical protein
MCGELYYVLFGGYRVNIRRRGGVLAWEANKATSVGWQVTDGVSTQVIVCSRP